MPEEKYPQPDISEIDAPETPASSDDFVWSHRKVIATIAGGAALFGSTLVGVTKLSEAYINAHPPVTYGAPAVPGDRELPSYGADECPEIPQAYVEKAERMLQAPENPKATKAVTDGLLRSVTGNYMIMPGEPYDAQRKIGNRSIMWDRPGIRYPVAKDAADKLGLTLFDNRKYAAREGKGKNINSDISRAEVLNETQKFLQQYDITIRFATKKDDSPVVEPIGNSTIGDIYSTRIALYEIANTIATFPKEYIALSGIKEIVLANKLAKPRDSEVYTQTAAAMSLKNMWVDVDLATSGDIAHEIGHGFMQATCGGAEAADHDKQLSKNMQGSDAYDPEYTGPSYDSYADQLDNIEKQMFQHQPYRADLKELQQEAVKEISTTSAYGHTAIQEDGAEAAAAITTDDFYKMRHAMAFPKLRQKLSVTLGRLLYYRPKLAEYFMQTSLKHEKTASPADAILPGQSH